MFVGYVQTFMDHGQALAAATKSAMGQIYATLLSQAYILGYNATFSLMEKLTATLAVIAVFMPGNNPHAKKAAAAAH